MAFQIDVFLLMFFLILPLAWLWHHGWLPLQPSLYWLLTGMLCRSGLMLTDLSHRFTRTNEAEPKGSNPQSEGKAFYQLGSGKYKEMR